MKRLAVAGIAFALLAACAPQQEINVTANRSATLTTNGVRLSGYLWCNRPVSVDFFVRISQDGVDHGAGDETFACEDEDPAAWSRVFDASGLHAGRAVLTLQASTNETGRQNNDSVELERFVDLT